MIGCLIKIYAVFLGGGVDVGRVAHEGTVSVFGDVGEGVIAETPIQATKAIHLVKYRPRRSMMYRQSIVSGLMMDLKS